MNDIQSRLRETFERISPPVDIESIVESRTRGPNQRQWARVIVTVTMVLAAGVGSYWVLRGNTGDDSPSGGSTAVENTTSTTISTLTSVSAATSAATTPSVEGCCEGVAYTDPAEWPAPAPTDYAVVSGDQVTIVSDGGNAVVGIPDLRDGVVVDGTLIFGREGISGTWVWPPEAGLIDLGDGVQYGLLTGSGTETSTRYEAAGIIDGLPVVVYREIETAFSPQVERLVVLDRESNSAHTLFEKTSRAVGLTPLEQHADVLDVAVGGTQVLVLFGTVDKTWIEAYGLDGASLVHHVPLGEIEGLVVEISAHGSELVLGVDAAETGQANRLLLVDLARGTLMGVWAGTPDIPSLRHIAFDGSWITAVVVNEDGGDSGLLIAQPSTGVIEAVTEWPLRVILGLART